MKKHIVMLLLCLLPLTLPAAEIEGVKLTEKVRLSEAGPDLVLNGAGVRTRFVFKVYVGALYLQQKQNAPNAVLSDAGAKRVLLHMLREVSSDQLFSALNDGLKDNHTSDQLSKIETQIREFEAIFKKVGTAKTGDVLLLDYLPGPSPGTRITVNGEVKGSINGAAFFTALLRVWLGEKPAEASLKSALLGV